VIWAALLLQVLSGACFFFRLLRGPTLADRTVALNGLILVGMSTLAIQAVATGNGSFLPVIVVLALVGFISTGMVARYLEAQGR
jgi:multicomponent Na+:H+ antiporter subunit F